MSVLTVVRGPGKGASIALAPDRAVTIGSGGEVSLRIGGPDVADEHLVVKALKDGGYGAKGLAGSFLHNGRTVAATRLNDGDVLQVGDSSIRFAAVADAFPEQIGGFRILGVLGEGGMGRVYRAEQTSLGREVALKVLSRERTADPMFVGHFVAEARAAARLNHPNVVQVFDVDHDGETYYYSMELMHGGSVEELLRRRGKLPVEEAVPIVLAAARALGFAEQMRVVHRDIKPDNLMIDRHGHVKVADLGLALTEEDVHGKAVGTPHFMSPEQVRREKLDHRSDLYSLGCAFYRLVTGRTPFSGSSVREILAAHLKQEPERADAVEPSVPAPVADVIHRLMAKDPDDRPASAVELIASLEEAMAPPGRSGRWVAAVVLVLAVGALGVLFWPRSENGNPTPVIEYVKDPDAERAMAEKARLEAENALLQVRTRGLTGAELAAALESMAEAHPETEAAAAALAEAEKIRGEIARAEREAAARAEAIAAAIEGLRAAFRTAIAGGDLVAAHAALDPARVPEELREEQAIRAEIASLRSELGRAAEAHVRALQEALATAFATAEPDVARQRLAPLAALVAPGTGWPDALLPDPEGLRAFVTDQGARIEGLARERAEAAERAAWQRLTDALSAGDGPVAEIRSLRPAAAAAACRSLAAELDGHAAGSAILRLAPAFEKAQTYVDGLRAVVGTDDCTLVLPSGDRAKLVGIAVDAENPGLDVQPAADDDVRRVPMTEVRADPGRFFPPVPGLDAERAALVGALAWTQHMIRARAYLAALHTDDDASGTGEAGYGVVTVGLDEAIAELQSHQAEWTTELEAELSAVRLLARGLRALSDRRNLSAAAFVERLLRDHPDTLVVRSLR